MSKKLLAVLFVPVLALAACSSDSDEDLASELGDGTTTEAPATDATVADTTEAPTTEATSDTTVPGGLDAADVENEVSDALSGSLGLAAEDLGLDEEQFACMMGAISDDPDLLAAVMQGSDDPDWVPDGVTMAGLFQVMGACDLAGPVAESIVADDPSLTQEQAECMVTGMFDLPPEVWETMMSSDPTATPDASAMGALFDIFDACGIDPFAL